MSKRKTLINTFIAILLLGLIPTVYDTIKVAFIDTSNVSINIFGQIEWFDLINETISMFLIVPLYFIIDKYYKNKENLSKLFLFTGFLYILFILISITQIDNLTEIMNATDARYYLLLESIGFILGYIYSFAYVYFVVKEDYKTIYSLLLIKVLTMVGFDFLLKDYSGGYGVIYAGILSQLTLSIISLMNMVQTKSFSSPFDGKPINKAVLVDLMKIGLFQGCSVLLANIVYAKFIMGFVNNVEMAGVYWIANNFIWGYLLLPINSLGEIIKAEANKVDFDIKKYFGITTIFILIIVLLSPFYKYWLEGVMLVDNIEQILTILKTLSLFYFIYMFNIVIDSYFVGKGKTNYLIISSLITNLVYYPLVLRMNIFNSDIIGICQLFGFGMLVNFLVILFIYIIYTKFKRA